MAIVISGKPSWEVLEDKNSTRREVVSLRILSLISGVSMCFLAIFKEIEVSGMVLSWRVVLGLFSK